MTLLQYLLNNNIEHTATEQGISVGGNLYLRGTAITALPDNLTVRYFLVLEGTAITALPDNLTVGESLYLRGTAITALPDNLTVGGSLYLRGTAIEKVIYSDKIGSRSAVTTYAIQFDKVTCGCFGGTLQQFEEKVHSVYPLGHQHRTDYDVYIERCKKAVKSYSNGGAI